MKYLQIFLILAVFLGGVCLRALYIPKLGNDHQTYVRAVDELLAGVNPYIFTVKSFSQPNYIGDSGFAYLPGFLYLYSPIYLLQNATGWNEAIMWKIPIVLADVSIAAIIYQKLKKNGFVPSLLGSAVWLFNPYIVHNANYTYYDPLTILLMLLALHKLGKNDVSAGALFALAVGFKTFPILLLPVFLYYSRDKIKFLAAGGTVAVALLIPFMKSLYDFATLLQGSLFVHESRRLQGRPFLFYISYMYRIEIFQIIPLKYYTAAASFSGWVVTTYLLLKNKLKDKYILSTISFALFYLFTPVLNRTYLLWFLPVFLIAMSRLFGKSWRYYASVGAFYAFYFWYLALWTEGFHVKVPMP